VLCGRRLDAAAAAATGLVLSVTTDDGLLEAATDLARRVATAPRDLVLLTKRSLYEERHMSPEQAMELEEERQLWSLRQHTTAERLRALAPRER